MGTASPGPALGCAPPGCTPSTRPLDTARGSCWGGALACVGSCGEGGSTYSEPRADGETGSAFPPRAAEPGLGKCSGPGVPWAVHQLRIRPVLPLTASVSSSVPQEGSPWAAVSVGRRGQREALHSHTKVFLSFNKQSLRLVLGSRDGERKHSPHRPSIVCRAAEPEGATGETAPENRVHSER